MSEPIEIMRRQLAPLIPIMEEHIKLIRENETLKAENERLRKLQEETAQAAYSWRELYQMLKARWEAAAKEGSDAK